MSSNDIPPVPQFLLRDADRVLIFDVSADTDRDDDRREGDAGPVPFDLSGADLPAPQGEAFGKPAGDGLAYPAPPPGPGRAPAVAETSGTSRHGYSATDAALFRALTGYRLDSGTRMPRAVDGAGNRVPATDRLFTTLAEEAFKLADRQRRLGASPDRQLSIDDLAVSLTPIRRAAAAIGSRGVAAFDTLEAAMARLEAAAIAQPMPAGPKAVPA